MKKMWDTRYSDSEYAYGEFANAFFREELSKLDIGRILLPAEGEGRNAVSAALHGWDAYAFDYSDVAKNKAVALSEKHGVSINYEVSSIENYKFKDSYFDCISLIYVHVPEEIRRSFHHKIINSLAPGGTIILEGFSKKQLGKTSGGPKDESMLFSANELRSDFEKLDISVLIEEDIELNEGKFHQGSASVVRLVATRP